ncbi:hypothetical protein WN55_02013 [Dufourea novaeangliae]|uniref:Uncharacterized protein n=1 Tax=Dufourea novaeangliae TaxID=178035 RepID=A0A154NWY0_DUFNO|nr:hypothetical protein WN55_02013 [Dufourea novaeangliae]
MFPPTEKDILSSERKRKKKNRLRSKFTGHDKFLNEIPSYRWIASEHHHIRR